MIGAVADGQHKQQQRARVLPAMPPIRIHHPKGVSIIDILFDSHDFIVQAQDLQEIYAVGIFPSLLIEVNLTDFLFY